MVYDDMNDRTGFFVHHLSSYGIYLLLERPVWVVYYSDGKERVGGGVGLDGFGIAVVTSRRCARCR